MMTKHSSRFCSMFITCLVLTLTGNLPAQPVHASGILSGLIQDISGTATNAVSGISGALSKLTSVGVNLNAEANFTKLFDALNPSRLIDPDERRTLAELVASRGFLLQSHTVQSEDGYLTTLHRVVPGNYSQYANYSQTRKPLIAFHGLMCTSDTFLFNSPFLKAEDNPGGCGDTFGFCAVQSGRYDLWLANARGNAYSTAHVSLSTKSPKYWKFSFDEMAKFDLPGVVDYVRAQTGRKTVSLLGHSQGGNIITAMLALRPEYGQVVRPVVTWAPGPFIGNITSPMKPLLLPLKQFFRIPGKLVISYSIVNTFAQALCIPLSSPVCEGFLTFLLGATNHLNTTRIPTYLKFIPSGASNQELLHLIQLVTNNDFIRFDYGTAVANRKAYGQSKPPQYQLDNIPNGFPYHIFYGSTDTVVVPDDVRHLVQRLGEAGVNVTSSRVDSSEWNHLDFVTGLSAGRLLNDQTIAYLDQYYGDDQ